MKFNSFFRLAAITLAVIPSIAPCFGLDNVTEYTLNEFKANQISANQSVTMGNDSLTIGNPASIGILSNGIVVVLDTQLKDHFLTFYNMQNTRFAHAIGKGMNPKEAVYIRSIQVQGDSVLCYDRAGKILSLKIDPSTMNVRILPLANVRRDALYAYQTADCGYLMDSETARYQRTDSKGAVLEEVGIFPVQKVPSGIAPNNSVFPVSVETSPDKKHIVCANQIWNKIELYDGLGHNARVLSGPKTDDSDIQKRELPFGHMFVTSPSYLTFQNVCPQKDGFMVGYVGMDRKTAKETGALTMGFNQILTFAWNGKPLHLLSFDHYIKCFDYNDKTKELICIAENNGKNQIIKYDLSKISAFGK